MHLVLLKKQKAFRELFQVLMLLAEVTRLNLVIQANLNLFLEKRVFTITSVQFQVIENKEWWEKSL